MPPSSPLFATQLHFLSRHEPAERRRHGYARSTSARLLEATVRLVHSSQPNSREKISAKRPPPAGDPARATDRDFLTVSHCAPAFFRNRFPGRTRASWGQRRTLW